MVDFEEIPYVNLGKQARQEIEELQTILAEVANSGVYVGGSIVDELELKLANFIGVKEVVTLNSGTDALLFSLHAAGIKRGDEVITAPNSFIASAATIAHVGAKIVFADVGPDQNICPKEVAKKVTTKTKAIMPVHLTGRPCKMDEINEIANEHNLIVIEDAAQSIGTCYNSKKTGALGDFGCFSTHPLKNLNSIGDGGFVSTNDSQAAALIRRVRSHGLVDRNRAAHWGFVSRMDTLQAAFLLFRLTKLEKVIKSRRTNAKLYQELLNKEHVFIPNELPHQFNTYHTFVIQVSKRDELRAYLKNARIKTSIHYPIPLHLQEAAAHLKHDRGDFPNAESQAKRILSLPINQHLSRDDIIRVSETINKFFQP